jgi:ABC-2 type transport system permease protein
VVRVASLLIRYNVRSALMYRGNFLMQQVMTLVLQFGQLYLIGQVLARFRLIDGWTFADVAFLIGLRLLAHGVYVFFCSNAVTFIDGYVTSGDFIRFQVRPIPTMVAFLCSGTNLAGISDFGSGVLMIALSTYLGGVHWTAARAMLLLMFVAAGSVIELSVFLAVATTSLWTGDSASLFGIVYQLHEQFILYPLNIYNVAVQVLLTVVPLGFINFYPAYAFLDLPREPWSHWALLSPVVAVVVFGLVAWQWRTGTARYEGTGS